MSADVYRQLFVDFARAELATGGPDPQVRLFGSVIADRDDLVPAEKAFRCGLFVAPYTVGAGALLSHLRDVAYPREASRQGIEKGEALVQFTLTASGEVKDIKTLRSSHSIFARNSERIVREYKCQGQGREVTVQVPFGYKLQ